jgi:WD40 repeat protein
MAAALDRQFASLIPAGEPVGAVRSAAFSPDGSKLVVGSDDGISRVWDVQASQFLQEQPGPGGAVQAVALGPDDSLAVAGNEGKVRLWRASDGTQRVLVSGSTAVHAVAFSESGAMLAAGGNEGTVTVWNVPGGGERFALPNLEGTVWAVAFAPDDRVLATGGDDGIVLWDMQVDGHRLPELKDHAAGPVRSVAYARDGATLAAGGADGTVRVWDVNTRELRHTLPGHANPVRSVAFSPDSTRLAAANDDGTVRMWDMATGELGRRLPGRAGRAWSVAYGTDDVYAAVGRGQSIRVRPLNLGRRRLVWRPRTLSWKEALKPVPGIFDWYKNNAAAGTLFLGVFLVVKGYVIAKGDLTTALGILQYAGLASVVIAGLLSALPILAAGMLAFAVYRVTVVVRLDKKPQPGHRGLHLPAYPLVVVTVAAAVVSAVFTPWPFMAGAVVIGLFTGLFLQWADRAKVSLLVRGVLAVLVAGSLYAVVAMLYTVWVPHEIVAFTPGPKGQPPAQETGYVLSEDDGWITILTSGPHQIVRYQDSAVKSFQVCERVPDGGWSDAASATTLWQEITKLPLLGSMHAAANTRCPSPHP